MKVCVDFDDLCDNVITESVAVLSEVKAATPAFKATLFTIPQRITDDNIKRVKEVGEGWLQLAPHGWRHTRGECLSWNSDEARAKIELARDRGIDAPIFRAPAWLIDKDTYDACGELNYIVASHVDFRIPQTGQLEYIYNDTPPGITTIHGHLTPVAGNFILDLKDKGVLTFDSEAQFVYPQDIACVF